MTEGVSNRTTLRLDTMAPRPPQSLPATPGMPVDVSPLPAPVADGAALSGGANVSRLGLAGGDDADYVRGLYRSILGREADGPGLEHHMKLLSSGMSREQMRDAIMASKERQLRDAQPNDVFVRNLYRELLNREPSQAELAEGVDKLAQGFTRDELIRSFLERPDYEPADTNADRLPQVGQGGPAAGPGSTVTPGGPAPSGEQVVRDGGGGFLWKPVSDSDGKLAVLLPPAYSGNAVKAYLVGPNGQVLDEGRDGGVGNGDRQHYRFPKPGGRYPDGTTVVVELANGERATWKVQNTAARND